jgi:pimeloyl-ACP methyl ester carboxylesterase
MNGRPDKDIFPWLIGYTDSQPVSFIIFYPSFPTSIGKPGIHIEEFCIKPEHRGISIGKTILETIGDIKIRRHGTDGPMVIVLHGGPGAPGSAEELAVGISDVFSVIEPWQRKSGTVDSLTVARHVSDLHKVIQAVRDGQQQPALVGESWGAMLALAYASEYPSEAGAIVLIGCGTFDKKSRSVGVKIREERIAKHIAKYPEFSDDLNLELNDRIMKWHEMTDTYKALSSPTPGHIEFDEKGFTETWNDMLRCQENGLYPAAFSRIISPVLMLHGSYDPHPGRMTRDQLKNFIPQLEYREFDKCGHQPSIEMFARDEFFLVVHDWLAEAFRK